MRPLDMDMEEMHARLVAWLRGRIPSAQELRLAPLKKPSAGFSNETFLSELSWREDGQEHSQGIVIRLEPTRFLTFPEYDLSRQFRIMKALSSTDVPVPRVLWLEEGKSVLGCSFFVMERVDGEIPSEVPPLHVFGYCKEATPERRAKIWWSGIETLARIHAVDWKGLGLSFLGEPKGGTDPIDKQLDYYEYYLDWARRGEPQPILQAALKWLRENRYAPRRVSLCWGDARLGNLIFRNDEVVAVLDWEMAFLGDPEADLGWWIYLDWALSEGTGIPRLEGFPGKEETIRYYEKVSGTKVENYFYNEVFAAFRFGVIMCALATKMKDMGLPVSPIHMGPDTVTTRWLAKALGLAPPGQPQQGPTRLEERTVRVQFHLTGPGGHDWYLVAQGGQGTRHEGTVENPDVTVTASAADWYAIRRGEIDRTEAFIGGRLKVEGDMTLLMRLEDLISRLSEEEAKA